MKMQYQISKLDILLNTNQFITHFSSHTLGKNIRIASLRDSLYQTTALVRETNHPSNRILLAVGALERADQKKQWLSPKQRE